MARVALEANVWYNLNRNIVMLAGTRHTPLTLVAHLSLKRRCTMDTLSPHADNGNIPEGHKWCNKGQHSLPATLEFFGYCKPYRGRKARLKSICRQCKIEMDKGYNATHREERKQYRASRKEEDKLYMAQWRQEHHEELKQYDANYRSEHQEQSSRQHKIYCDQYYKTDRGRVQMRVSSGNRRARKRNAAGTHTTDELHQQYQRQKGKCYYCHKKLGKERKSWVAEHVIPLSRGGSNSIDNIVIACIPCNLRKGSKLPHEWVDGGRLL